MRKNQELSDPNSCINRASSEEPIFVLRANDELAPLAVMLWAGHYHLHKTQDGREMTDREKAKHQEALTLAYEMRRWKDKQESDK